MNRQQQRDLLDATQALLDNGIIGDREPVGPAEFGLSITSATPVVLSPPESATGAVIHVRTASVVYTLEGTIPTATKGSQADDTDIIVLKSRAELVGFRAIAVSTTLTLDVEYFRGVSNDGPSLIKGRLEIQGNVAHNAVDANNPVKIGGVAGGSPATSAGDLTDIHFDTLGKVGTFIGDLNGSAVAGIATNYADAESTTLDRLRTSAAVMGLAPDSSIDVVRTAGDVAPGLGAFNVAPIGGDMTLRASAAISVSSGTGTILDNLGWVKSFLAHLDVTAVRSGGSSNVTLDVYIQTQLPSGDWQDIVHFTQIGVSATAEVVSWDGKAGPGTQAEGAAVTVDNYFAEQDAGLTVTTVRLIPLGDSMRVKWVYAAGDSTTGDYTFALVITVHS